MSHTHNVVDTDKHFIIDAATRAITTESNKLSLMQGDHNSEIYTFEIPKVIEGHDMSLCNRVEIHFNNVSADKVSKSENIYYVPDLRVDEEDPEKLAFSWLVSGNATKYAGALAFRVRFCCIDDNGNYTYKWHTDIFKGITISDGLDNTAAAEEEFSDAFSAWEARLDSLEDKIDSNVNPIAKTEDMTQPVGVDENGQLYTAPGGSDYTLPVGGDELGGVKNGGNVVINEDGTMTAPESEVTDEQVSSAVSEWIEANPDKATTVQDGSITQEKLADNAVIPTKTSFWRSEKPYIIGDNFPIEPIEVLQYKLHRNVGLPGIPGWSFQLCEKLVETDNVKVLAVKAGVKYTLLPSATVVALFCTSYAISEPTEEQKEYWGTTSYAGNTQLSKILTLENCKELIGTQSYRQIHATLFRYTPETDGFIIFPSTAEASMVFKGASPFKIYENFLDKVANGEITTHNNILYGYQGDAKKYGELAKGQFHIDTSNEFKRLLRTGNYWDDLHSSNIKLFVMGDSITWAASNIGADKAYRTLLNNKYNITHRNAACNGTTITAGLGSAWISVSGTFEQGVDGLINAYLTTPEMETTDDERYENFIYSVNDYPIFTIAFGTNDFRNNAPIGTINDTDSSTFMGGYKKLIARIRDLYPNSSIILCTPWKQENWNTPNSAGYVLADYNLAIHEIASKTRKCFVLDMFNNPYINEKANSSNGVYHDNVHLGKYGHILIAEELEKLILKCIVLNGYPYAKTNLDDSWTGM